MLTAHQVHALARRFGTPFYAYELDQVDDQVNRLFAGLPNEAALYYSVKANPHPRILERLANRGCRFEVSSPRELQLSLAAGASGSKTLYTGPAPTQSELEYALRSGCTRFSVESFTVLDRLARAATATKRHNASYLLRVAAHSDARGSFHMTSRPSQFGITPSAIAAQKDLLSPSGRPLTFAGLHFYSLSNARSEADIVSSLRASLASARALADQLGVEFAELALGGGFAAPWGVPGPSATYSIIRREWDDLLGLTFNREWPDVAFESGRYLVGECGTLVASVMDVKIVSDTRFVLLDAGINVLGGLAGLGRSLPGPIAPTYFGSGRGPQVECRVTGPLCTPADVLGASVPLPADMRPGDLLAIPSVGAYGATASLVAFLSRPPPTEVVLEHGALLEATRTKVVTSRGATRGD